MTGPEQVTGAPAGSAGSSRLSRRAILDGALILVQREGVDALTMRRLAAELGSRPMSLYRHVSDKREVLDLILERVCDEMAPPEATLPPREAIVTAVEQVHRVVDRNRWLVEAVLTGELLRPGALRVSERLYAAMAAAGLDDAAAARFHVAIWQYLWGHVVAGHVMGLTHRSRALYVASGAPDTFPEIGRMEAAASEMSDDDAFRAGFLALVAGFLP